MRHYFKKQNFFLLLFLLIIPFNIARAAPETLFLVGFDGTYQDFSKNDSSYMIRSYQGPPFIDDRQEYVKFGTGSIRVFGDKDDLLSAIHFVPKQDIALDTDEFTIDLWVYPYVDLKTDNHVAGRYFQLLNTNKAQNALWPLIELLRNNTASDDIPTLAMSQEMSTTNANRDVQLQVPAIVPIEKGKWNHIAIQRKNTTTNSQFTVSVNGKMGNAVTKDKSFRLPISNRILFNYNDTLTGGFFGFFDEIKIVKGAALWGDVAPGGTFDISKIVSSITPEMKAKAKPLVKPYEIPQKNTDPSLLLSFDDSINDSKGSTNVTFSDPNLPKPVVVSDKVQVGKGSVSFNANKNALIYTPKGNELTFGSDDFTIDFWIYPRSLSTGSSGETVHIFSLKDASGKTFLMERANFPGGLKTPMFGPIADHPENNYTFGSYSIRNWLDLVPNQWNHVALQREGGSIRYIINGVTSLVANPVSFTGSAVLTIAGMTDKSNLKGKPYSFDGYIDNFRVTKAARWPGAIQGDHVIYGEGGVSVIPPTPDDLNANRAVVPGKEAVPLVSNQEKRETAEFGVIAPREVAHELLIKRPDGSRHYTNYYDASSVLISSIFWAENTGDKKIKTLEYDEKGELAHELHYGPDETVTDTFIYHSKDQGGGLYKEIRNRDGIETSSRYNERGKVVYSHQVKRGTYLYSKYFTYDDADRLTSDLKYYSATHFEKNTYLVDGGDIKEIKNYVRTSQVIDGADYVYTDSIYTKNKLSSTKKLYAQGESLNLQKVEMVTYDATGVRLISQRTFDYANNLQKYLTYITTAGNKALGGKEAEYVWKIDSGDFQYKTSYDHDVVTGALVTKTKVTGPGDITIYRKDGETIDNESVFTFFPNNTGWKDMTTKYYDKDGAILKKIVVTFYQDQPYVMELSSTYDGKDVLVGKTFYKNGVRDYTESNDSAGKVYFKTKYSTAVGGTEYTSSRYYVLGNQEILQSVTVHDASSGTLLREVSKDNLAKKKFGDAILASQGITLNDVNANTEKAKTLEILNKFLPQYKTALSASGLSAGQKYALYVDFSRSIVYSFWALEYKIWATDRTKQLSTDEEFTYNSAVAWTGVDAQSSKEFWGIYINPAGVSRHSPDSAFVDMDINNPQIVDAVISAGSFDSLKNITKKKEKWDSVFTGPSFVFDTTSNKTLYYYNMAANGGTGAYLNLAQLTAADPTVNLILDRMQEDLGMSLNSSLSEEDIVKQFYTYFYKQSIFQYLYDFGDTVQTVNQTLVRGGGDCEDFGTFAASLLKNLFIRLGKQDAANRVGLGMAVVDVTNKISTTNQGIGHASLMFKSVQGKYYWIESAYLFMGNAAKLDQSTILAPLDNTKIGGSGAMTTKVKIVPDGWYVEVQAFSPVNGKAEGFTTSLGGISMQIQTPTLIGTSATEKISTLPTYIEPYNKKVNALADSMLRYIPRIAEQTPTYIAEYVNTFVKIHSNYKTDTGGDNWARVGETLGAVVDKNGALLASIQGDCEDLGFVEASLLQNMLTKYYVARGMALTGAILKAQGNVMVVAQNNYGGVANKTHLLVALVDLSIISNNLTTVVLMDPQVGGMTEVMPFSSLFKGDYIFFASSRKVSAISYYDWNNLNLSSAAGSSLGSIDSIVEEMIEPVEPGYELFSDSETAAAVRAVEGKIDAGELPEFLSKTDTSILKDALSEPYTPEEMARDATIFKNDVANAENSIGKTDKAAEKKVAEISNKTELSLVEAEQGIVASLEQQAQQAVRDANFGAVPKGDSFNDMLSAVTDSSQVKQKTLDAQLQNVSELAGQGLVSKNTIELVGQNIDSSANALNVVAKVNSASNLLAAPTNTSFADYGAFFDMLNNPDTFSNSKNLGKMGNDISSFISNVAAISPSGAGKLPPSYSTTFSPSGIQTYFGEGPSLTSRIEHPNILYMPIRGMLQCVATTPLCQSLPTGTIVKTKPDNSYFAGSGKCSSTTYSCDDTTYNTGWFCNPGFILSGGRCIPIEPPVVVATSTLTVTISGTGSGVATSTPVGINCTRASGITAGTCSISFNKNSLITLTASSTSDSLFTGWSGGGCSGTGVCSVTMDVSKIVDAQFTLKIVGPVRPDLMPNDVPDITGPSNSTWIDSNVTPGVTYFIPGTILTLKAQPKNSGPGVVPSVLWNVKFQAKLSNQALTQYIDLPNIASVPVAIGALLSGAVIQKTPIDQRPFITHKTDPTLTSEQSWDFRYCVDMPPNVDTAHPGYLGNVDERQSDGSGENNNCSAVTTIKFKPKPADIAGFDYSIASLPHSTDLVAGNSWTVSIIKTLTVGTTQPVTLNIVSTTKGGVAITTSNKFIVTIPQTPANYNPSSPTQPSTLPSLAYVTTDPTTPLGVYTVIVQGVSLNTPNKTTTFIVNVVPPTVVTMNTFTVTTSGAGAGSVISTPSGISCGRVSNSTTGTCSTSFTKDSTVKLTVTTASNSTFAGWSGASVPASCVGKITPCDVVLDVSKIINVDFTLKPDGPPGVNLVPNDVPEITGGTYIETVGGVTTIYYEPGTTLTLKAQPKNSGPGVVPSVLWNVKFQAKLSNQALTQYIDLPNIASVPVAIGALLSGAVIQKTPIDQRPTITHVTGVGFTAEQDWDFRYCVDMPPNDLRGNITETNENDNCSEVTMIRLKPKTIPGNTPVNPPVGGCPNCGGGGGGTPAPVPPSITVLPGSVLPSVGTCNAYAMRPVVPGSLTLVSTKILKDQNIYINEPVIWKTAVVSPPSAPSAKLSVSSASANMPLTNDALLIPPGSSLQFQISLESRATCSFASTLGLWDGKDIPSVTVNTKYSMTCTGPTGTSKQNVAVNITGLLNPVFADIDVSTPSVTEYTYTWFGSSPLDAFILGDGGANSPIVRYTSLGTKTAQVTVSPNAGTATCTQVKAVFNSGFTEF